MIYFYRNNLITENQLPEWASIYYIKITEQEYKCNICEALIETDEKSLQLLEHIKRNHKEVYELHRSNTEATVGFHIEFLQVNVLKDDEDPKTEPVILEEVCEASTDEISESVTKKVDDSTIDMQFVLLPRKKKRDCGE